MIAPPNRVEIIALRLIVGPNVIFDSLRMKKTWNSWPFQIVVGTATVGTVVLPMKTVLGTNVTSHDALALSHNMMVQLTIGGHPPFRVEATGFGRIRTCAPCTFLQWHVDSCACDGIQVGATHYVSNAMCAFHDVASALCFLRNNDKRFDCGYPNCGGSKLAPNCVGPNK